MALDRDGAARGGGAGAHRGGLSRPAGALPARRLPVPPGRAPNPPDSALGIWGGPPVFFSPMRRGAFPALDEVPRGRWRIPRVLFEGTPIPRG